MELLPAELLAAGILSRLDSRSLGRVACTSRAVRRLASADGAWRPLLLEQGMTNAGIALWQDEDEAIHGGGQQTRPPLMRLFAFADRYHEALEFEVLSHRPSRTGTGGHWNACLEFANPWPKNVWTFFASHSWVRQSTPAEHVETVQLADIPGACSAEGFAATFERRGEVVLLHLQPASLHRDFGFCASTSYGVPRHPDHIIGVLLPPGAHAERLVSIGEHAGLGFQQQDKDAECFHLEVVQAEDVQINGIPIANACPFDLASTGGAIVPTTRATPTVDTGPAFDWGARKIEKPAAGLAAEPQPAQPVVADADNKASDGEQAEARSIAVSTAEEGSCSSTSTTSNSNSATGSSWELDEDAGCVIDCKGALCLSYKVLRRSVAFRSIP
eukprot:COSAG02_NODE_769_length_17369_cov_8.151013_5_plen_387_part_00